MADHDDTSNEFGPALLRNWRIVVALAFFVFILTVVFFDRRVSMAVQGWPSEERFVFERITDFGEGGVVLVPALVLWIVGFVMWKFMRRSYWTRWSFRAVSAVMLFTFVAVGLPGVVGALLKRFFGRARPVHLDTEGVFSFSFFKAYEWDFQSFPSGHATTSLAFALAMTLLFGRAGAWLFIPATLIAFSRVVIGVHFLSDMEFGAVLGMVGVWGLALYWRSRGMVFASRPGWRNRFAPILRRQWTRLSQRRRDSGRDRPTDRI